MFTRGVYTMKLLQILLSQPQKELVSRVKNLGITCNTHSRQQLTEALSKQLLDKEEVSSAWDNLNKQEKHLLLQMSCHPAVFSLSSDELKTCLKRDDREEFLSVLTSLKQKGWIYEDDYNSLLLPQELKEYVHKIVINEWAEDCIIVPQTKQQEYTVIQDLFEFMDIIEAKVIPLTKNKTIYKKELTNILSKLNDKETFPSDQWRFGYGRHFNAYPDRFSLLYDFCYTQGWIVESEKLEVGKEWATGQQLHVKELLDRIQRFYVRLYRRPIPQLPFVIELMKMSLKNGRAVEKQKLIERINGFVDPYYYDKPESIVEMRIINMLLFINFLSKEEIDGIQYVYINRQ